MSIGSYFRCGRVAAEIKIHVEKKEVAISQFAESLCVERTVICFNRFGNSRQRWQPWVAMNMFSFLVQHVQIMISAANLAISPLDLER